MQVKLQYLPILRVILTSFLALKTWTRPCSESLKHESFRLLVNRHTARGPEVELNMILPLADAIQVCKHRLQDFKMQSRKP